MVKYKDTIVDIFSRYTENNKLNEVNILHIYPLELTRNNGVHYSRFFQVLGFNTRTMERRDLGRHDEIRSYSPTKQPLISNITVFMDRSTVIVYTTPVVLSTGVMTQTLYVDTKEVKDA